MTAQLTRRQVMRGLPPIATVVACSAVPTGTAMGTSTSASDRKRFMDRAFEMRRKAVERGDQAFGAVVVKDGQVVGEGISAVVTGPDPTAHGEVQAIRDAARRLGTANLGGCELYTTFRPCPMCETAAHWAGIVRIYHGEAITDAGPPRYPRC
jgi:tRNA(Arg) A34 adenosine deaminase TadA